MKNKKLALRGFSRMKLFPIKENTTEKYSVEEGFSLPEAQEMTRDANVSEETIFSEDGIYLNLKSWNGLDVTITIAEITLDLIVKLGFGEMKDGDGSMIWKPQGKNNEYALTFRCLNVSGGYRLNKMYSFIINEIIESAIRTKGEGTGIAPYQIIGTITNRRFDDTPGEMKDIEAGDLAGMKWLDSIDSVPATEPEKK